MEFGKLIKNAANTLGRLRYWLGWCEVASNCSVFGKEGVDQISNSHILIIPQKDLKIGLLAFQERANTFRQPLEMDFPSVVVWSAADNVNEFESEGADNPAVEKRFLHVEF